MSNVDDIEADRALKTKHKALWSLGDYPAVAAEVIPATGPMLVAGVRHHGRPAGAGRWGRLGQCRDTGRCRPART